MDGSPKTAQSKPLNKTKMIYNKDKAKSITRNGIKEMIKQGYVLYDVCNDYSLEISTYLEKERWQDYALLEDGGLVHVKHCELHYKLSR
tara:strand:+ start:808 stop:1074 length:267 start_codon:yes stop_codon:yes gene_type:complete